MAEVEMRGTPPPPKKVKFDVIRITTSEAQTFVCLSRSPWGQPIHWHERRSHECTKEHKKCQGCDENWPSKWQAYLHVQLVATQWQGFLELTQTAWEMLKQQCHKDMHLRGMMFRVAKTRGGPKGRYIISVLERRIDDDALLKEMDPYPTLEFLWKVKKQSVQA